MADIRIQRQHGMSLEAARQAARHLANELAEEFALDYAWEGDCLRFRGAGVSGTISLTARAVEITARLGIMTALLWPNIEAEIHRFCDENFGPEQSVATL